MRSETVVTILSLGLVACGGTKRPGASAPPAELVKRVTTAEVVRSNGAGDVAVPGVVQARTRAALAARIPASVVALPYDEGESVPAGAVVVRLDDAAIRAAVAAAEVAARAAQSDLARTQALIEKDAATPRELEQMTAVASGTRAQLTAARDNLSYSALRAPFAGRVAARRVNVGDVVSPGLSLIEIEGEGGLEVRATAPSEIAGRLSPGVTMKVQVDGQPEPLVSTVAAVAPSGDATTHRFEVKVNLPPAAGLRAGLFARLLVPGVATDVRLFVPATALVERGGLTGLFVVHDGHAGLRWVAAGAREDDIVEIRAGIEAGERVVVAPVGLVDGDAVREEK